MSAEPWFVKYERDARRRGRGMSTSLVLVDEIPAERPAPTPHTPGVLWLIRDALLAIERWLR